MARLLFFFTLIILMASCRSTRQLNTAINKKDSSVVVVLSDTAMIRDSLNRITETLLKLDSNRIEYRTFSAKVNVDYRGFDGKNYDVNAHVRMLKDSIVWINVNAFMGMDAMRVMITQDSVKLINKLDKVYTARSVDYLKEITDLPLDLQSVQDLIIGNPVFVDPNIVAYSSNNNISTLLTIGPWFKTLLTLSEPNKGLMRIKMDDADLARNRTADLSYTDYEEKKGFPFSTKRRILVTEAKRLDIKLDFKQYELNPDLSFPFSIPKNYTHN